MYSDDREHSKCEYYPQECEYYPVVSWGRQTICDLERSVFVRVGKK